MLCPENPEGNIEYKWKLMAEMSSEEIEKKKSQMLYRLKEGNGEAFYYIGIKDNGYMIGLDEKEWSQTFIILTNIFSSINCSYQILEKHFISYDNNIDNNRIEKYWYKILIQEKDKLPYIDIKIGIVGNVDSGKSTLIGVLTKGCQDNGRGLARTTILKHPHEKDTGRTSSIGHEIIGFDQEGKIIRQKKNGKTIKWNEMIEQSKKIITFYDLAGHEKYLKTTIYGLSSFNLDYCLVMVGANMGLNHMTREHIMVCLSLQIPIIIVFTKMDITPLHIQEENKRKIEMMCQRKIHKIPFYIKSIKDVHEWIRQKDSLLPIIEVSNVTLQNMSILEYLLSVTYPRMIHEYENKEFKLQIDGNYNITGFYIVNLFI